MIRNLMSEILFGSFLQKASILNIKRRTVFDKVIVPNSSRLETRIATSFNFKTSNSIVASIAQQSVSIPRLLTRGQRMVGRETLESRLRPACVPLAAGTHHDQ